MSDLCDISEVNLAGSGDCGGSVTVGMLAVPWAYYAQSVVDSLFGSVMRLVYDAGRVAHVMPRRLTAETRSSRAVPAGAGR
jgi:hypothetical protein